MCGISGIIGQNIQFANINSMTNSLKRRGPDNLGIWINESQTVALGQTRLSIIDLSNLGNQPMFSLDRRFVIVFNGEIYNYEDIKIKLIKKGATFTTQTDTEVILRAWELMREESLILFRGMFSFAIWDNIEEKLVLVRDRLGIKPMLYSQQGNKFLFASTISSFIDSGLVNPVLDTSAFQDYLSYGSVFQPKTIIKSVHSLMPGTILIYQNKSYTCKSYWNLNINYDLNKNLQTLSQDEIVRLTRKKIEEACQFHLVSDVPIGSFLSGGVDSTVLTAMMSKFSSNKINTYSIGFENKYKIYDELEYSRRAAKFIDTNHTEIVLDGAKILNQFDDFISVLDQPSIDGLNTYWVSHIAKNNIKVAISGLGADEIFAGYEHFKYKDLGNYQRTVTSKIISAAYSVYPNRFMYKGYLKNHTSVERLGLLRKRLSFNQITDGITEQLLSKFSNNHMQDYLMSIDCVSDNSIYDISKFECKNYLLNTLLRDTDAIGMGNSVEIRPIFLDHELVEFALALPDELKMKNGVSKFILKEATKDLIPINFFNRPKKGFTFPIENWMYNEFKNRFVAIAKSPIATSFFKESILKKIINDVYKKQNGWNAYLIFVFLEWASKIKLKTEFEH